MRERAQGNNNAEQIHTGMSVDDQLIDYVDESGATIERSLAILSVLSSELLGSTRTMQDITLARLVWQVEANLSAMGAITEQLLARDRTAVDPTGR